MAAQLTAEALAARAGTSPDRVREMSELGILAPAGDAYGPDDVGRVVIVEALVSEGVALPDLARAVEAGALSLGWFGGVLPPLPEVERRTFAEAVSQAGLPREVLEQLFALFGVAVPSWESPVREDDAVVIGHLGRVFAAFGGDRRLIVASARYFGDNVRRVAQSQMDFFRRELVEPRLASGRPLREVIAELGPFVADVVRPAVRDLLLWLYRRHLDTQNTHLLVQLMETALQEAGVEIHERTESPAIAFLDLSGFTRLTEEAGDQEAVGLATQLTDLVRVVPAAFGGTAVKLLGDGVMLHFEVPAAAVRAALRLVAEVADRDLPSARVGIHAGPLIFRDGDYFGRTVNLAARITDYARPGEVLISEAVHAELRPEDGIDAQAIGPVALRGVSDRIRLFSVRAARPGA